MKFNVAKHNAIGLAVILVCGAPLAQADNCKGVDVLVTQTLI